MKKILIIITILFIEFTAFAQQDSINKNEIRTLFGQARTHGGYGAPEYRYAIIDGRHSFVNGGRGGWIINHSFSLGLAGYSFRTAMKYDNYAEDNYQLNGGYGGLLLEATILYKQPLHFNIPVLIGVGGVSYSTKDNYDNNYSVDAQPFFAIESGLELELNVLRFFKIGFGAYYRYTNPIQFYYDDSTPITLVDEMALNNLSFGIALKFGKF